MKFKIKFESRVLKIRISCAWKSNPTPANQFFSASQEMVRLPLLPTGQVLYSETAITLLFFSRLSRSLILPPPDGFLISQITDKLFPCLIC